MGLVGGLNVDEYDVVYSFVIVYHIGYTGLAGPIEPVGSNRRPYCPIGSWLLMELAE